MRRTIHRLAAALLASGLSLSALAAVTASLDRSHVGLGETVRLQMQSDSGADRKPDIGPLQQDFVILGSSRGSSTQIVNGHLSSRTQVTLVLAPKREGTIPIPPLRWGAEQSAALELTVGGGNGARPGADTPTGAAPVSMTATLDQKHPYVQSAVVLTIRLYVGTPISQASLDLQGSSDLFVKQLGDDAQSTESRNGRVYQVIERKYVLVPQRSGQISLKGPVLQAQVQDTRTLDPSDINSLFGRVFGQSPLSQLMGGMRPLRLSASAIDMDVLPRPAAATGTNWLPAQKVTLEESWRPESGTLHAGEPLTRHLHLTALGLTGAQLPDISKLMPVPDGIKVYPDQAKTDDSTSQGALLGSRDQDVALIASQPGHYELPGLRLFWWDTTSNTQREANLPARTLDILQATGVPGAVTPPSAVDLSISVAPRQAQPGPVLQTTAAVNMSPWQWISAAMSLLWLGTLLAWWRSRRVAPLAARSSMPSTPSPSGRPSADKALTALERACRDNDPQAAQRHLLDWAAGFWPESPPRGLHAIAQRLVDARFTEPLQQLDRACYAETAWQGEALMQAFAAPPRQMPLKKAESVIPDLYG